MSGAVLDAEVTTVDLDDGTKVTTTIGDRRRHHYGVIIHRQPAAYPVDVPPGVPIEVTERIRAGKTVRRWYCVTRATVSHYGELSLTGYRLKVGTGEPWRRGRRIAVAHLASFDLRNVRTLDDGEL